MKKRTNVLFVTIDGGGNLPPVLGLAKEMSENGFKVSVLSEPCVEKVIKGLGYDFIPFQRYFTRKDRREDIFRDWNASPVKNPVLDKIVFGPVQTVTDQTMEAIRLSNAELLVADCLLPTALIAADARGIPGVLAFHMPEYLPGANRPPGMFGVMPGRGAFGRARDRILTGLFNMKLNGFLPAINETRTQLNLPSLERTSDLFHGADLRLIQTLERFDFPLEPKPANVRYMGPVLNDPDWTKAWTNPWPEGDTRPLVVISLSSTFQNQQAAIQSAMDALRNQEIRGLVTLGPALNKNSFDIPENVIVVDSAPHSQVFPEANLVITHAGHGTLMRALSHGLPLLCLPMGRDQNDNAAKVNYHGCGITLSSKAGAGKIRMAVQQILTDKSFKEAAVRFQGMIQANKKVDSLLQEIRDLVETNGKKSLRLEENKVQYAS